MGDTPRFGLNYFGEDVEGSFTEDGSKHTYGDRLTIDRLLAAIEAHNHAKPVPMPVPQAAPVAVMSTDGSLTGGSTFYYGVAFVDQFGLETAISSLVEVSTPDILSAPETPQVETVSGGGLAIGTYLYGLTALRGEEESVLSATVSTSVTVGQQTVRLTLPDYGDADSFRVWRLGPGDPGFTKIDVVTSPTYDDDGSVPPDPCSCDPENLPPSENDGIALYAFTLTLGAADAALVNGDQVFGWRLYRSEESGVWPADALVHYVVERTTEGDPTSPLVTSWKDDGDESNIGAPPLVNQSPAFQPLSIPSDSTLPDPLGYQQGYPFLLIVDGVPTLYVIDAGAWVPVAGGGSSDGGGGSDGGSAGPVSTVMTDGDGQRWVMTISPAGVLSPMGTAMPGPPDVAYLMFGDRTYNSWAVPAHDGGMPITGYVVETYDPGIPEHRRYEVPSDQTFFYWAESGAGSGDVLGSVSVAAKNEVGAGVPSTQLTYAPGAPYVSTGTFRSESGVTFSGVPTATVPAPMDATAGDLQVLVTAYDRAVGTENPAAPTDTSGWTNSSPPGPGVTGPVYVVWWRIAPDGLDVEITFPGAKSGAAMLRNYTVAQALGARQVATSGLTAGVETTRDLVVVGVGRDDASIPPQLLNRAVQTQGTGGASIRLMVGDDVPVNGYSQHRLFASTGSTPVVAVTTELT